MKRLMKNSTLYSVLLLGIFFFSGCDAAALLRSWIRDIHHNPDRLTVLVFPPIPLSDQLTDTELMKSLNFAKRVRSGIMGGVHRFNEGSSRTAIDPVYYTHPDKMIEFYDELWKPGKSKDGGKLSRQLECCQEWLDDMNRSHSGMNASCLVFGTFLGKSIEATHVRIRLCYYDSKLRRLFHKEGAFPVVGGRELQGILEETMVQLLKEAVEDNR